MNSATASKQAFSQARNKISHTAFQELHECGLEMFYTRVGQAGLWRGFRLIGVDGSTVRLPNSVELENTFGRGGGKEGDKNCPIIARISEFTDMTTKLVLSGRIEPYDVSEKKLAEEQLPEVVEKMRRFGQSKMLFVYDRGYPSEKFMDQHVKLQVDFLFRLPKNFNRATKEIAAREDAEGLIMQEGWPPLRLVKIPLSSGETEYLLTTLCDKAYTANDLSEVYQGRWTSMEEGYKKQKITMQLENFSGKTVIAVRQEYWATLVIANLLELDCTHVEGYWIPGNLPLKQVNRSVLFGSMRDATMKVILGMMSEKEYSRQVEEICRKYMLDRRPNRNYSRVDVGKPKWHHVYRRAC